MPIKKNRMPPMWAIPIIVIAALVLVALVPLAFIWALDALFGLNIAYSITTWFAALIMLAVLCGGRMRGGCNCNCGQK